MSPALYIPVHRRSPTASRTPSPSPSSSSFTHATLPSPTQGVYTPAELLSLSTSPLAKLSTHDVDALRALIPEVVQTRRQRKALAWHTQHPRPAAEGVPRRRRTSSHGSHAHTSESDEDGTTSWRRIE